jgi:CBS domain containing-hemolysin-like protein
MSGELAALLISVSVLLIAFGGLLAAADSALLALSRADLLALADRSPRTGKWMRAIANDTQAHLNAISFVRVLAESAAAVFITVTLVSAIDQLWLVLLIAAIIMTGVTFVLVGSSPRTVGAHNPESVLRVSAPLVHGLRVILGPVASGLIRIGDRVTPGRRPAAKIRDEQQLLSMVDQAAEADVLEEDDREYIHSVLEFGDTLAREVMIPRTDMVTVDADTPVRQAVDRFLESRHSRLPVISDDVDDLEGVLYLRDATRFALENPKDAIHTPARKLMKPAVFVPESQKADDLLRQMQLRSNHMAIIVDEYGGIAGLVTMEDLIEELLGDISDEHDRDIYPVAELGDGVFRVSARLPIDELGDVFGIELDDDDVDTVGGLFTKLMGRLADVGDVVEIEGIVLTAETTQPKRKNLLTLTATRPAENLSGTQEESCESAVEHTTDASSQSSDQERD